ncbi:hypothetical protein [Faecalibaculum rodentium]|uniref:hypothetical protein n=1 Tax=Faecalibaculum rodentium TaxID=1702221 RepID=UPI002620971F|nr:hypothetical protein [Faecalibaculum rodentium]
MAKDQANGGYRREGGYRNERKDNWKGRDFRGDSGDTRDRRNFRNDQDRRDRGERGEGTTNAMTGVLAGRTGRSAVTAGMSATGVKDGPCGKKSPGSWS